MPLINDLIEGGWLKTPRIIKAFEKIKRADFLPENLKGLAELNEALPIGYNQTISQPLVVAFMLEGLQPEQGNNILDIGSGSGWTSALLAEIVKETGRVISLEIVPELREFGQKNTVKYSLPIQFVCADGSGGYKEESPYDRILCSAALQEEVPLAWKDQLKVGGRMVVPINSSIWFFVKNSESEFSEIEHPGFSFVPFVKKQNL